MRRDLAALKVEQELSDHSDLTVTSVPPVNVDQPVQTVNRVEPESQEHQAKLVYKDHQEHKGSQDNRDRSVTKVPVVH